MKRLRNGNNVSVRNFPLRLKFYSDRTLSGQRAKRGRKCKLNAIPVRLFGGESFGFIRGGEKVFYGRRSEPYGRKRVEKRNTM